MKHQIIILFCVFTNYLYSQNLQLHYDFRHSVDPEHNDKNFPVIGFEYFKLQDSGSFFIRTESNLIGQRNNIGQLFMQVSQNLKFWKPKIYLHLEYSGGMGIAEPDMYGYYISNAFAAGASYPFQWNGAWLNVLVCYKINVFKSPSHDVLCSLYWGKGFWDYKLEIAGDIELWTENKNHGDDNTAGRTGKRVALLGQPQIWYNFSKKFSIGSKIHLYYHVVTDEDLFQAYPTAAIKYKF